MFAFRIKKYIPQLLLLTFRVTFFFSIILLRFYHPLPLQTSTSFLLFLLPYSLIPSLLSASLRINRQLIIRCLSLTSSLLHHLRVSIYPLILYLLHLFFTFLISFFLYSDLFPPSSIVSLYNCI